MLYAAAPIVVGLLWGLTNPLIRQGELVAYGSEPLRLTGVGTVDGALHRVLTPAWAVPQLINVCGSLLFAWSLGFSRVSVAGPVANGVSLAANAVVDHLLGDRFRPWPGILGLALVLAGITLCTTAASDSA